jgi:hypothetical protein
VLHPPSRVKARERNEEGRAVAVVASSSDLVEYEDEEEKQRGEVTCGETLNQPECVVTDAASSSTIVSSNRSRTTNHDQDQGEEVIRGMSERFWNGGEGSLLSSPLFFFALS